MAANSSPAGGGIVRHCSPTSSGLGKTFPAAHESPFCSRTPVRASPKLCRKACGNHELEEKMKLPLRSGPPDDSSSFFYQLAALPTHRSCVVIGVRGAVRARNVNEYSNEQLLECA